MSVDLDPTIIKRTQDTLGKYVRKPHLTDKLLKKPPFRFLYDIFGAIIRDIKCFEGLYTLEELTYENIKDRDDKMKFLQKMIDVVKLTTGSPLTIKTSKIVAGHEPEKTNELLQLIGEIIDRKLDWQKAVEKAQLGKVEDKESLKTPKEMTNKVTKDKKSKDKNNVKPKEKNLRPAESKKAKSTADKMTTPTSKDEKTKISKTKESTSRQLVGKEKNIKSNKEIEKMGKRSVNVLPNVKPKLKKSESNSSNKSSPSLKTEESVKDVKSLKKETDCNHEEMEEQKESTQILSSQVPAENQKNSPPQSIHIEAQSLATEISKKSSSGKKRRSTSNKLDDVGFGEQVAHKENKSNVETTESLVDTQQKLENLPTSRGSVKHNSFASTINHEQQQVPQKPESNTLDKNVQEPLSPGNNKPDEKPTQPSPTADLKNEIKRESTFTHENSIESNRGSLANRPKTSLRPPSARPPSARPGAPRRRDKNIEIILQPNDQIKMSGIQVKLETFGDLDDDDNLVVIENSNASDIAIDQQTIVTESEKISQGDTLEQGHLVQQILETQKELVQQQNDANSQQKNDKDSANNSVMRQTSARHMNNLRDVIQNITKSINPLGKLMDFIPEDIDAMQLEFTLWRDTYTQAANELKREKSLTESATEPMKNQLVHIEANIVEYTELINASRVKILQNSEKITKMLTT